MQNGNKNLQKILLPKSLEKQKHPTLGCSWFNLEIASAKREEYINYLGEAIREAYVDASYLASVMEREGFEGATKLFKEKFENNNEFGVRTGDFGEVVGHTVLMDVFNYKIPVYKIRYKTNWKKAAFGVDIIAFHLDDGDPSKDTVVFSEVKASTQKEYGVKKVFEEINQLVEENQAESQQKMRNAVRFVSERLFELKQYDLEKRIYRFLDSYTNPNYIEAFYPFLVREKNTWATDVLDKITLVKPGPDLITLCVFIIEDLDSIIQDSYKKAAEIEVKVG